MAITCLISMFICNTATCAMMCPILKVRFLVMSLMMGHNSSLLHQVVLEQVYWREKSKKEGGVEGDGKILTRKQNLEQSRQDREKVVTLN